MRNNLTWSLFLIIPCVLVSSRPMQPSLMPEDATPPPAYSHHSMTKQEVLPEPRSEQVISVRITSSVAVGRGKGKLSRVRDGKHDTPATEPYLSSLVTEEATTAVTKTYTQTTEEPTAFSPDLSGANMEFIKQLHSKKEARGLHNFERIHSFTSAAANQYNDTEDSIAESSLKSVQEVDADNEEIDENIENVPLARSVSHLPSSRNYVRGLTHKPHSERENNPKLTTVSFNILHDSPKTTSISNGDNDMYLNRERPTIETPKLYNEGPKYYNEPAKVYSQPAQLYSEPAKFYSEPAKVYSEPAKIYSEPAKVYSEPAKIYSEPAKFYSQPASLHLPPVPPNYTPWQHAPSAVMMASTTPISTVTMPPPAPSTRRIAEHRPEQNYEVDEKLSVLTDGRSHGVQETTTESCKQENCKVGYVVEGRQYRKYRVEERTADGFIVGEYGVVRHEDGALRGVRYTADGDASPRLIYDALMKFLQLK